MDGRILKALRNIYGISSLDMSQRLEISRSSLSEIENGKRDITTNLLSKYGEIVDIAVDNDIIQKSGAWFSYNGEKVAQGRDNAVKYLENNPAIADEIESKIREKLGVK